MEPTHRRRSSKWRGALAPVGDCYYRPRHARRRRRDERAAAHASLEVISGVEIATEYRERELHLLAYFVAARLSGTDGGAGAIRRHRIDRFHEMVRGLHTCGIDLSSDAVGRISNPSYVNGPETLGRRHLAEMLVQAGKVGSVREAFSRYLKDGGRAEAPKVRLPVAETWRWCRAWRCVGVGASVRRLHTGDVGGTACLGLECDRGGVSGDEASRRSGITAA